MISVIIPVFNTSEYIDECVQSVVSQTYKDLEILLIDDCSTDGSSEKLDQWVQKDKRIRVIHKELNSGVSNSRNIGLKEARGEYISFIDSDDWLEQDMYAQMLYWIENRQADIAISGMTRVVEDRITRSIPVEPSGTVMDRDRAILSCIPQQGTEQPNAYIVNKLFRSSCLRKTDGLIFFDETINYSEDTLWLITVMLNVQTVVVWQGAGYVYRTTREGNTQSVMKSLNDLDICDSAFSANYQEYRLLREAGAKATYNQYQKTLFYQRKALITAGNLQNREAIKKYKKGYLLGLLRWWLHNRTLFGLKWLRGQLKWYLRFVFKQNNRSIEAKQK